MYVIFSASKPPTGPAQPFKGKLGSSQGGSAYPLQRQSSRVREQKKMIQKLFYFSNFLGFFLGISTGK